MSVENERGRLIPGPSFEAANWGQVDAFFLTLQTEVKFVDLFSWNMLEVENLLVKIIVGI